MPRVVLLVIAMAVAGVLAASALAHSWPGRPLAEPPRLTQGGPPPAWIETRTRARWLHFSSYCWKRAGKRKISVNMPPVQERSDVRLLTARAGALLRLHLGFRPREVHLTVYSGLRFRHYRLA